MLYHVVLSIGHIARTPRSDVRPDVREMLDPVVTGAQGC